MSRDVIRTAAIQIFAEQGFHATTLRQIARVSGVTLGTIYHYYPSKEELLAELMSDALRPLIESGHEVLTAFPDDPVRQLFEAVRRFVLLTLEQPDLTVIGDVELRSLAGTNRERALADRDEYEAIVRSIVADGTERGLFNPGDVKLSAFAVLAISNQPASWYRADGSLAPEDLARMQASIALRIVGADAQLSADIGEEAFGGPSGAAAGGNGAPTTDTE